MWSSFVFPFSRANVGGFGVAAGSAMMLSLLSYGASFAGRLGALVFVLSLILALGICAAVFEKALHSGMEGRPSPRDWVVSKDDLFEGAHVLLASLVVAFWPLLAASIASGNMEFFKSLVRPVIGIVVQIPFAAAPAESPAWGLPSMALAAAWGLMALPVAVVAWTYFKTPRILDPIWTAVHAIRGGWIYAQACVCLSILALLVVGFCRTQSEIPPWLLGPLGWFLFAYVGTVAARVCGLVYFFVEERWGWRQAVRSG